jgi:hypothetical protein
MLKAMLSAQWNEMPSRMNVDPRAAQTSGRLLRTLPASTYKKVTEQAIFISRH